MPQLSGVPQVSGLVDILVETSDFVQGSANAVIPFVLTVSVTEDKTGLPTVLPNPRLMFQTLPLGTTPAQAFKSIIYSTTSTNTKFELWATNFFNPALIADGAWDSCDGGFGSIAVGTHTVRIQASNFKGPLAKEASIKVNVDCNPSEFEFLEPDGSVLVKGGATNQTTIVVTATDTVSGLDKVTLLQPNGTTSTQTVTFGTKTANCTFSALSTGTYTAKVYDVAGNVSSAPFMVGSRHFLDGRTV